MPTSVHNAHAPRPAITTNEGTLSIETRPFARVAAEPSTAAAGVSGSRCRSGSPMTSASVTQPIW